MNSLPVNMQRVGIKRNYHFLSFRKQKISEFGFAIVAK